MRTPRFARRAASVPPTPDMRLSTGLITVGGVELTAKMAAFVDNYLVRFNGADAARAVGQTDVSCTVFAARALADVKVRAALRNALIERQQRVHHDADEVSRYWWALATADARELSGVLYVPCRHCHGVDHDYQFTDIEQRQRERDYHAQVKSHREAVARLQRDHPDADLPEAPLFFEAGGAGYTTNKYPVRGPDWAEKVQRYFDSIERPVPEGLVANSDHSCPACHGDGVRTTWLADTRHLSPAAAMIFNGVRQTKDGVEIKVRDRDAAMEKFAQLTGMVGPLRVAVTPDMGQLSDEDLGRELSRRGVVIDGSYEVVGSTREAPARRDLPALPRPDLLRPREAK